LRQREAAGLEIEQIGAEQISRHHVRRELDTAELQRQAGGERLRQQCLRGAGHAFEQYMPSAHQAGQHQVDHIVLTDHRFADLAADVFSNRRDVPKFH
jgi:hypothetical protein